MSKKREHYALLWKCDVTKDAPNNIVLHNLKKKTEQEMYLRFIN